MVLDRVEYRAERALRNRPESPVVVVGRLTVERHGKAHTLEEPADFWEGASQVRAIPLDCPTPVWSVSMFLEAIAATLTETVDREKPAAMAAVLVALADEIREMPPSKALTGAMLEAMAATNTAPHQTRED
jgi:hypothetical protein